MGFLGDTGVKGQEVLKAVSLLGSWPFRFSHRCHGCLAEKLCLTGKASFQTRYGDLQLEDIASIISDLHLHHNSSIS